MLTDAGALTLALLAQAVARRARSGERTFGHRRADILTALANGAVLGASSIWIIVEAVRRLRDPPEVHRLPMLIVAAVGLLLNLVSAAVLSRSGQTKANVRAAAAHVAADATGSVAAILAGVAVWAFGWNLADPIISMVISVLILWSLGGSYARRWTSSWRGRRRGSTTVIPRSSRCSPVRLGGTSLRGLGSGA